MSLVGFAPEDDVHLPTLSVDVIPTVVGATDSAGLPIWATSGRRGAGGEGGEATLLRAHSVRVGRLLRLWHGERQTPHNEACGVERQSTSTLRQADGAWMPDRL